MNNSKFKFTNNLLKASNSDNIDNAINEWCNIYEEKRNKLDGLCICGRKVKNIRYMYNSKTQLTISVGLTCADKFELKNNKLNNKIIKDILKNNIIKGEYENIDNILLYSNNIKQQLYEKIKTEYNNYYNNYFELKKLYRIVNDIIDNYNFNILDDIKVLLLNKIDSDNIIHEKERIDTMNIIADNGSQNICNFLDDTQSNIKENNANKIKYTEFEGVNFSTTNKKRKKEKKIQDDIDKVINQYEKYLIRHKLDENYEFLRNKITFCSSVKDIENYNSILLKDFIRYGLIKTYNIKCSKISQIIRSFPYIKNKDISKLSDILIKPFSFITYEEQLLTFEQAYSIHDINNLTTNKEIIFRSWIIYNFIKKYNSLYVKKSDFINGNKYNKIDSYKNFKKKYSIHIDDSDFNSIIKIKVMNNTEYYTTEHFMNIEKNMSDIIFDLIYSTNDNKFTKMDDSVITNILIKKSENEIDLNDLQIKGIINLIKNNFAILTGGPGTGKSTCMEYALSLLLDYNTEQGLYIVSEEKYNNISNKNICVSAPTGIAFKSLSDKINKKVKLDQNLTGTLHKLIYDIIPKISNNYKNNDDKISKPKLIIVDETSMVDIFMFNKLLDIVKMYNCKLWLLGDHKQLPPIGAGQPFRNIIEASQDIDDIKDIIVKLTENKRSNKDITIFVEKMNSNIRFTVNDFENHNAIQFIEFNAKNSLNESNVELLKILNNTGYENNIDTILLTAQNGYNLGTINLNKIIQNNYNTNNIINLHDKIKKTFKIHDRVVRIKNDYSDKENTKVNGDQATITKENLINNTLNKEITISYDTGEIETLSEENFEESFDLFYACTIHKLQGSDKDTIYLFMPENHCMWNPNSICGKECKTLLYTAISRAKKKLIIIGNKNVLKYAQKGVHQEKPTIFMKEGNKYNFSDDDTDDDTDDDSDNDTDSDY